MNNPPGLKDLGVGARVTYRNFIFCLEVHFPVKGSATRICPTCKKWKGRKTKMIQRMDISGNRWWYCRSNFFKRKWHQCGNMFPVDMLNQRIRYLNEMRGRDK
jgi:hypothetical protein